MNKNIPFILLLIWFVLSTLIFVSCEDNEELAEKDQDTIATTDTVRFQDLNTLFQNRCYQCHSEQEYSFYALNLDTYENTMLGSQNGSVVVPFEPEQSLLYNKCSGEHTEGERMPQDDLNYFDEHPEKLQLIYDWIYFGCLE